MRELLACVEAIPCTDIYGHIIKNMNNIKNKKQEQEQRQDQTQELEQE